MKFAPLILKHLRRNWVRTASTVAAMSVCIFLFCTLQTFVKAVTFNLQNQNASRLATRHRVSLVFNMPVAYQNRIAGVPGVKAVMKTNWFGGVYIDMRNFFSSMAVDPEEHLAMYPELMLPEDQKRAYLADMRGAMVGKNLAKRFGWKVGDIVSMESFIPPYRIGKPFDFIIRGIYYTDEARYPGTNLNSFFFHWKYLDEATNHRCSVGAYFELIDDPGKAGQVSKAIDDLFENSDAQTRTETESAFAAGFVAMAGNLALLLNVIALAVTFTILAVVANTMSMSVRERRTEIAVLKTLGFSSGLVMALILGEALVIGLLGGGVGVLFGHWMIANLTNVPFLGDAVRGFPDLGLAPATAALGMGLAMGIGITAGFMPAFNAYRARTTEMLREV